MTRETAPSGERRRLQALLTPFEREVNRYPNPTRDDSHRIYDGTWGESQAYTLGDLRALVKELGGKVDRWKAHHNDGGSIDAEHE